MPTNVSASVLAKLNNYRREQKEDFQRVLTQYVIQRFLFRLGVSKYKNRFLLKGSWMFVSWSGALHRPTKDVDMLGYGDFDKDTILDAFRDVLDSDNDHDDGVIFDLSTLSGSDIKQDDLYSGFRITCVAFIGSTRNTLQVDIGFGDAVTPNPENVIIQSVIDQTPAEVIGYPVYTVLAEKYHAMVVLGFANSRMKDFYDIITILRTMSLEFLILQEALEATFNRRDTSLEQAKEIYSDSFKFDESKVAQWNAFLRKNDLAEQLTFADAVEEIQHFMEPIHKHENNSFSATQWNVDLARWQTN
ncbi:MAG: hypothetical protein ACI84K_001259 [Pseudohongiellaceae bacterium]|jgi:hypothetical protein